jgi:hypothetical protein
MTDTSVSDDAHGDSLSQVGVLFDTDEIDKVLLYLFGVSISLPYSRLNFFLRYFSYSLF